MSNVWFCSDLHLGHKKIGEFRKPLVTSCEQNTERILKDWKDYVTKRDIVFVLGDFCFDKELFDKLDLPGKKILIRGNHDRFQTKQYLSFFDEVEGLLKYKGMWLSHAPIHENELRDKGNLHGHVHYSTIERLQGFDFVPDRRYLNCCPENLWPKYGRCLVSLDEARQYIVP